jgi:hypothetical protein
VAYTEQLAKMMENGIHLPVPQSFTFLLERACDCIVQQVTLTNATFWEFFQHCVWFDGQVNGHQDRVTTTIGHVFAHQVYGGAFRITAMKKVPKSRNLTGIWT